MITARIAAAQQAAVASATGGRSQSQAASAGREAQRAEREAERAERQAQRERAAQAREQQRMIRTGISTAGKVLTSRTGQDVMRGLLGTLLGGKR
jgi:hypothetical protein